MNKYEALGLLQQKLFELVSRLPENYTMLTRIYMIFYNFNLNTQKILSAIEIFYALSRFITNDIIDIDEAQLYINEWNTINPNKKIIL